MEHTRLDDDDPRHNVQADQCDPSEPAGPSKDDRRRALELAIEITRGRTYKNNASDAALAIAQDFAKYLHDGKTDQS